MLTREAFAQRFGRRAVFGMVHLLPLPGAPLFASMKGVIDAAIRDASALAAAGYDGMVFENFGDRPFFGGRVPPETVAAMTGVITIVTREVHIPFGVNVLRNDARAALAIAAVTGASFVRVNVHTGAMLTDQGIIEGRAAETLRYRVALGIDCLLFADHLVKHAVPLGNVDPAQTAKDLRHRGLADALIVSGSETGSAPDRERLQSVRHALDDAPLLVGSGLTAENADGYAEADGAIAGTSIKSGGRIDAPVDVGRAKTLLDAFRSAGGR